MLVKVGCRQLSWVSLFMALLQFWEAKPVRIEVIPISAQLKVLVCEHKYYQDTH